MSNNHEDRESKVKYGIESALSILPDIASDSKKAVELFPDRLLTAIGRETLRSFSRRCGFSDASLHHYLRHSSEPTLGKFVAIARAAQCNLLWLATGEGPMQGAGQVNETGAPYTAKMPINSALLEAIIEVVEAEAPQKSAEWKAKMAVALYDLGEVPREKRAALVRAAG